MPARNKLNSIEPKISKALIINKEIMPSYISRIKRKH